MKLLVIGSAGRLGAALMREYEGEHDVAGFNHAQLDLSNFDKIREKLGETDFDVVINAAAFTNVDLCETQSDQAFRVNAGAPGVLAEICGEKNARLIHFSTDYVFDGAKNRPYEINDARAPLNVYGRSKAEAEIQISQVLPECCILRTSWLFGNDGKCFPDTILKLAAGRSTIDVVDDQRGSPTYTTDLARTIIQLCRSDARGIVHATNRGDCSWFEFAREIVSGTRSNTLVRPTTTEHFVRPAQRPKYSVLSSKSLQKQGIEMPNWQDALRRYLRERKAVS